MIDKYFILDSLEGDFTVYENVNAPPDWSNQYEVISSKDPEEIVEKIGELLLEEKITKQNIRNIIKQWSFDEELQISHSSGTEADL